MRVVAKRTLREYWEQHANAEEPLKAWYEVAVEADWKTPKDIKRRYATASILPDHRVIFNIKGNDYRLVVKINYDYGIIWIRFIGTHAEYDKINAETI